MARGKLTALPSVVIDKDENEKKLDFLSEMEKMEIRNRMCRNVNSAMGDYFTQHRNEWTELAKSISK